MNNAFVNNTFVWYTSFLDIPMDELACLLHVASKLLIVGQISLNFCLPFWPRGRGRDGEKVAADATDDDFSLLGL